MRKCFPIRNAFLWVPCIRTATTLCCESYSPSLLSLPNYLLRANSSWIQKKLSSSWRNRRCVGTKGHSFILACNPSSAALKASEVFHETPTASSLYFFFLPPLTPPFWKAISIIPSAALTQPLTSAPLPRCWWCPSMEPRQFGGRWSCTRRGSLPAALVVLDGCPSSASCVGLDAGGRHQ